MAGLLIIDGSPLTPAQVEDVARGRTPVALSAGVVERMQRSRAVVEQRAADSRAHYGINTGFGALARQRIALDSLAELQRNLVRSHAAGAGEPLPPEVVRAMLLVTLASLARGASGVRPVVAQRLAELLNARITPIVPAIGSVGASGDLAPLAHIALVLIGEGRAQWEQAGQIRTGTGAEALRAAGLTPLNLQAKEGLSLINGTHLMAAQGALLVVDVERLFASGLAACAMSMDACMTTDAFLDGRLYALRRHEGPALVAERLRALLAGSEILPSHRDNDPRVQDPYSFRCAPLVLGAAWDAFVSCRAAVERELGAVTDNPLVFTDGADADWASGEPGGTIVSGGNFHGMPIALPLDILALAIAHVGQIAERRIFWMLSGAGDLAGLPPALSPAPGLHSGLMLAQYTAAACCNEMARLASPATVVNYPTSAGVEDYNSFGPQAAGKARRALELCATVIAIELLCAAEGLERRRPRRSGAGVERVHALVRAHVRPLEADRPLEPDIAVLIPLVRSGLGEPSLPVAASADTAASGSKGAFC